ncbi:HNH endonuclease [Nocardioides mangrovi]|uniref:13E12 repeat family protein n=1 Tax=Nocardioides mangrovi TaxID=2874580 RepID=A0ABS7U7U8_9ACTN|nr:13E12 repeat family protein [Nocardioides mangrovi]MBZ5736910.1 13E12 repeat family protein [Nocardioides mangrovi]
MFDPDSSCDSPMLRRVASAIAESPLVGDRVGQVEEIRALEELVCAAQARQLRLSAELDADSVEGRGVAEEVALARRESPHRGRQHVSLARIASELPHTMEAFRRGLVTEWRATVIARETGCLSREDRLAVDRAIAEDAHAFSELSDRAVVGEVRKLAARLDPQGVAERRRRAEGDRCVTIRPAPDTMVYLTALLPVAEGVAAYAALRADADRARREGGSRSRGQVMADMLVARLTGCPTADDGRPAVRTAIGLVMTDRALLSGARDPASIVDYGPIPANLARELVLRSIDSGTTAWLRRLYVHPRTGELVAMDSRQRRFPRALAAFLRHRDQWCRTPWCNAPIRHSDHVVAVADGGATTGEAGQGLCEACNYAKQAPGWSHEPRPGPDAHEVDVTTPTGHRYRSVAPPLLAPRHPAYQQVDDGRWVLVA